MQPRLADYPVRAVSMSVGGHSLSLLVVRRLEDHVDGDALLSLSDALEPPYWMHVWAASRTLARLVSEHEGWGGRSVVELGCGLGLPGIVAARNGAAVVLVDASEDALRFARANAERNRCRVGAVRADLGRPPFRGVFDVCLAADATYDPVLQASVADFLADHLAPGGRAWCADSVRTEDGGLALSCERRGLAVVVHRVREMDEGRVVWVRVTEVARP